ncbi:MAG TPA: phosphotransferase [Anaerolineales bacterium]|nr:phosphotransferase [Anaerolineales bacterium]
MLEKPNIPEALIISRLQEEYDLRVAELTFLPLGADMGTAVYRVVADDGTAYFLKLRKGFDEIIVTVPLFLKSQGIQEIIAPLETKSKQGWADFGEYKLILYPFIEGKNGFDMELTDHQRWILGAALKGIHSAQLLPELKRLVPQESFSPKYRENIKAFQVQVESQTFDDPTAGKLAKFMKSKGSEITHLVERTGQLALELQSKPLELVLCHTDIHGGNILTGDRDELYIVDWDAPLLAPKERDLMFIGGGIDEIWKSKREESVFYEGYGKTDIDLSALAYYRYERVIEDLAVICEQILLTDEGGADRERSYGWFTSNFEPGNTIEIADSTDNLLTHIT